MKTETKYQKLDLIQGTPEWKAARLKHVTASNVPSLFGLSPYKTELQYATELLSGEELEQFESKEILFAHAHAVEAAAREWAKSNLRLKLKPLVVVSKDLPCLMASLDGLDEKRGILFEAKYIGREALLELKKGNMKGHHECQVQAQLRATGYEKAIYFAMDPDGEAAVKEVVVQPDYQKTITEKVTSFWGGIQEGKLPEPSERDIVQVDDPELARLSELNSSLEAMQEEYDALKKNVVTRYGRQRVRGNGVDILHFWRKGNVDYARIPQLRGVDLERFRRAGGLVTTVKCKKGGA